MFLGASGRTIRCKKMRHSHRTISLCDINVPCACVYMYDKRPEDVSLCNRTTSTIETTCRPTSLPPKRTF
ncbi:hypothetical protein BC939DRAFT_469629 [Gamsiella multidivaricata]|uniref:uncharacterized protein n=1 Tax=Gamsiella multidivaricata TaxID=101098 RepID=UPI002220C9A6|nr:uncharacterized protein BC939DRAFT_469629 [Gamsiella multidivaricata]KAI7816293.1 hypothetical protein BC939DRAFT_469629 [Gamsiella multidivaricata]